MNPSPETNPLIRKTKTEETVRKEGSGIKYILTPEKEKKLIELVLGKTVTTREIAYELNCSKSTTSMLIRNLRKAGKLPASLRKRQFHPERIPVSEETVSSRDEAHTSPEEDVKWPSASDIGLTRS